MIVSLRAETCPRHRCYPLDNNVSRKPGGKGSELRGQEGLKDVAMERIWFSELSAYFNRFQTTIIGEVPFETFPKIHPFPNTETSLILWVICVNLIVW